MGAFLNYFHQDFGMIGRAFVDIFVAFFSFLNTLLNFPARMRIIKASSDDFDTISWVLVFIVNLLLIAILIFLIFLIVKGLSKLLKRPQKKENDELKAELAKLKREMFKLSYEKDKILAMKISEMGFVPEDELLNIENEARDAVGEGPAEDDDGKELNHVDSGKRNTFESPPVPPEESRFFRLTTVDNYYKTNYEPPVFEDEITLSEFCDRYRNFACSRLRLFYDISIIRYFVSSLAATRLIILQGISGTGKTSLPYSFGKYVMRDSTICAVQPAWRDRTELFGYFNEFTKVFNETDFLRAVYEANMFDDPHIIVLDEMNIARVEYYFAEMLSVLEMPRPEEWLVDIVTTTWDNDPCLLHGGKVHVNENTWFVGTINNDDSTFAVADKVYDRAIPIDLDSKATAFEAPDADPIHVRAQHLIELFRESQKMYGISDENMKKLNDMEFYVIKHFRLAFGNRIMRQLRLFVPALIAAGGTELEAIDFMVAKKILRKFESLNLGFVKDELHKFVLYLDKNFGKENFQICKEYLIRMQKMS